MKNMMRRNLHQSIRGSLTRYIAIVAIIALGAGMFVGLRTTKSDMVATGQRYMDEQNMFDLRLFSTYGWSSSDVDRIAALPEVESAEGVITMDVIARSDAADSEAVYKIYSLPEQVNRVFLHEGRMPQAPDECLADAFHASEDMIGSKITLSSANPQDALDSLVYKTYTVVGCVSSPLYMDMSRGNTTLGNGSVLSFLYLPFDSFSMDYYTEIAITLPGENRVYTDAYHSFVQRQADRLLPELTTIAQDRFQELRTKAEESYQDGVRQYGEALAGFELAKADMLAQLDLAKQSLLTGQQELDAQRKQLEDTRTWLEATGQSADSLAPHFLELERAEAELASGWESYQTSESEALAQLSSTELELTESGAELEDARIALDAMEPADVFALGRTTNVGYLALESNSDIVEGVSTVFPAFFLLIAALVCITTMTRMVEEERTQIGTLKALGYSNGAIAGKYLSYAGSAAVLGCGLGVLLGSVIFPRILWKVYGIMMLLGDYLVLRIDWPLCLLVVGMYTGVTLFVTWYCCRMSLREVPAELIRPKMPASGKKIFLERLSFWNRVSFLNKVMLRNIFRYRQRLLMMLVGIGGCTALLLTGFGVRDSIGDIAQLQFDEITLYDMEVRFSEGLTVQQQEDFLQHADLGKDTTFFYHQSSMELTYSDRVQDITFICADEGIAKHIDFHSGNQKLSVPGTGEALVSVGVVERMGISVGDRISVRDSTMRALDLTVSGIYDNNVYNYVVVTPDTVQIQWEEAPQIQMACVRVPDGADIHEDAARISEWEKVMSVTVNQDLADQVSTMLEALDLVVITIVICATLLAVTVLYNLTNINITERIREIATIKVLGFNARESAAYVFKENLLLSFMGTLLGLVGGIFLLEFVMSQIQVDMVWMNARLLPMSFFWSVVITMLAAVMVDFLLYFRLDKINMAEALKSVE